MNRLKYIILDELQSPIIFPEWLEHKAIAGNKKVVSAGFCKIYPIADDKFEVYCNGDSFSLGVKSRPEDQKIIERFFNRTLT